MNFVSGSGRELLSPLMSTGDIDALAFIGGSRAADAVVKAHPHPHRLKVFLQLEGKNLGIVMPDADIDTAVEQVTLGATSFNGQRCTAIKLVLVHSSIAQQFLTAFKSRVSRLRYGLPWHPGVSITPLPEHNKVQYLTGLINDALSKGASVINSEEGGCDIHGALFRPAIVYPVTSQMRLWDEEQFGPVIPVAVYNTTQDIYDYVYHSQYGQQAAIFTSSADSAAPLIDMLSTVVGRININTQCSRSPDAIPFSGRRSSALGTMSVVEALKTFSVETVVAGKDNDVNEEIMKDFERSTNFLKPLSTAHLQQSDKHEEL
jgi:glyceraldehyde-3-phosphate dehydrogenase (NADP+)